jgi:hypothetical protein
MNPLKERVDVYVPNLKVSLKMGFDRIVRAYMTNLGLPRERRFLRKEVIQPQVPLRLPCYDFTPVTNPTFAGGLLAVSPTVFWLSQLPWCDGRCVQGPGTYSPRRADPRLLAIPTSWSRVADSNPN